jgi:hypothetical protein
VVQLYSLQFWNATDIVSVMSLSVSMVIFWIYFNDFLSVISRGLSHKSWGGVFRTDADTRGWFKFRRSFVIGLEFLCFVFSSVCSNRFNKVWFIFWKEWTNMPVQVRIHCCFLNLQAYFWISFFSFFVRCERLHWKLNEEADQKNNLVNWSLSSSCVFFFFFNEFF